jgi:hypothetical protein
MVALTAGSVFCAYKYRAWLSEQIIYKRDLGMITETKRTWTPLTVRPHTIGRRWIVVESSSKSDINLYKYYNSPRLFPFLVI